MSRSGLTTRDRARGSARTRGRARVSERARTSAEVRDRGRRGPGPEAPVRERRRTRARVDPRRRVLQVLAVLLVLAGAGAWVLLGSPFFSVRTVQVDGARTLSAAEVREVAGIPTGTALVRVDTAAAAERVARLPQVASVTVVRGWPDEVVVTIAQRVPVAVVEQNGTRSLVDADGLLFDTVTGDVPPGVVPVDVPTPGPGDRATTAALAVVQTLPASVRSVLTGVRATGAADVTLTLTGGRTVLWGGPDDAERKARVLGALLQQIAAGTLDEAGLVDVSVPDSVVLR